MHFQGIMALDPLSETIPVGRDAWEIFPTKPNALIYYTGGSRKNELLRMEFSGSDTVSSKLVAEYHEALKWLTSRYKVIYGAL
jgi:hypothetical protein